MSRRLVLIASVCMGVALILCAYWTWERVEVPRISYNGFLYVKVKTLTLSQLESETSHEFQSTGRKIDGFEVYEAVGGRQVRGAYTITSIVLKEGDNKFVVYDLKP